MRIRAAGAGDLEDISRFLSRIWHSTYDGIYGRDRVAAITAEWHSVPSLQAQLARPDSVFPVALDRDGVAGIAYAAALDAGEVRLHQLYVDERHQGFGLAGRLLAHIEAGFVDLRSLSLEVEEQNTRAIAFYRKQGFHPVGRTSDCGRQSSGIPALVFSKQIAHADLPQ